MSRLISLLALFCCLSATAGGQAPLSQQLASLSGDLLALLGTGDALVVRVIVRGDVAAITSVAARDSLQVVRVLDGFVVLQGRLADIAALRQLPGIEAISRDARVMPFMSVSTKAMAADQARAAAPGVLGIGAYPAVTGKGVGVAVIDSGIAAHPALTGKVVAAVSFVTGDPSTNDAYGHGTHIAGIIAGNPTSVTPFYQGGIAPGAHLINVRVLGAEGAGYTSDVIAGIQWTVANRARYGIRVVNLSLGHPTVEPCVTDPLCLAVERAVGDGLVVVASAGNIGKNAAGEPVLASITTPGVAPSAITVGALNTWGTVSRDDDTVATYSSKGPTKYELGLKPDVVAPGNKIISLEAPGSTLVRRYPALHVAGKTKDAYMMMSGTSMAAGMVSGAAALLLEGGVLTSRQVKLALQVSASFMPHDGLLAAGAGSVNVWSARRVNGAVQSLTGVVPPVTIAGRTVRPSGLVISGQTSAIDTVTAAVAPQVLTPLDLLQAWLKGGAVGGRLSVLLGGVGGTAPGQQILWGDQTPFSQQILWGDQTPFGQQILWGDQTSVGQQLLWGDQTAVGQQLLWGDQTSSGGQQLLWGDADASQGNQILWGDSFPGEP